MQPLAERQCNDARRSTRIETKVQQRALMDRVAKSVKRELKTLGYELKTWQEPQETARKQRDCVAIFTAAQQEQRERSAAMVTASAAASVLAKRLRNQSPCRPAIKPTRVHALGNIALKKVRRLRRAPLPRPAPDQRALPPRSRPSRWDPRPPRRCDPRPWPATCPPRPFSSCVRLAGGRAQGGARSAAAAGRGTALHDHRLHQPVQPRRPPPLDRDAGTPELCIDDDDKYTPERHLPTPGQRGHSPQRHAAVRTCPFRT